MRFGSIGRIDATSRDAAGAKGSRGEKPPQLTLDGTDRQLGDARELALIELGRRRTVERREHPGACLRSGKGDERVHDYDL